jgi:hypothetical protein
MFGYFFLHKINEYRLLFKRNYFSKYFKEFMELLSKLNMAKIDISLLSLSNRLPEAS